MVQPEVDTPDVVETFDCDNVGMEEQLAKVDTAQVVLHEAFFVEECEEDDDEINIEDMDGLAEGEEPALEVDDEVEIVLVEDDKMEVVLVENDEEELEEKVVLNLENGNDVVEVSIQEFEMAWDADYD